MTHLHCPKCAAVLERNGGALACGPGRMALSLALEQRFVECYVDKLRAPRDTALPGAVGGRWFCPACGIGTTEATPGDVRCPRCARALNEFLYDLVTFHPHKDSSELL